MSVSTGSDIFTGNIKLKLREIPYAHFPHFCHIQDILNVLIKEWKLDLPKIMLLIVSDAATLKNWDSYQELENFVNGLIKGSNATSMWIFTNGLNIGISKIIGDAFQEDYDKRNAQICARHAKESKKDLQKATLIGLCREGLLTYQSQFETSGEDILLENKGNNVEESKFNLNQHHTHFMIIKDQTYIKDSSSRFLLRLIDTLYNARNSESGLKKDIFPLSPVPFLAILVQGNLNSIQYILAHLKRNLPVLVVKGSGGLADVFAFAYLEVRRSFQKIKDKEYVETILRRGLNNKITSAFPDLKDNKMSQNLLCGRILECIKCSDPPEMKHITVLNILDITCNMEDLPVYLLQALFKSEKSESLSLHEQLKKELQLTIDWNCPEIALTKVFYKDPSFKIENAVFEQALLQNGREAFVSLFLDNGFEVHKYFNTERLIKLFEESLKENFFREVCWEGILGYRQVIKLDKSFIDSDLNWIIESLIGIPVFVSSVELDNGSNEIIDESNPKNVSSIDEAKRKAITMLIIWALLSKRVPLAMVLWQHSDTPVMTALTASLALDKMQVFVSEKEAKEEISELSQKFASMAFGVFDLCYSDVPSKAYDSLNIRVKEWAGFSFIDMASQSQNRTFVSHSCCQKWLTNKFMGNIKIRDLTWGFMTFPVYIKVILCAFLVFPMYLWVRFKEDNVHEFVGDDGLENADPYSMPKKKVAMHSRTPRDEGGRSHLLKYQYPSMWKMIFWMWSAPITKFWVSGIFYIIYLVLFSLAVLMPSCGNTYLDAITCFWTLLIAVDSMYRLHSIREAFPNTPLFATSLEIVYMLFFVLGYFLLRVTRIVVDPYGGKVLICIGLIWFYYRMIFIYLPISSTLGPLLYRVKTMISVDFINFFKLLSIVLIGNGIAMQALLYPDYPFIAELIRKAFHKAFITLFLTPTEELTENDSKCVKWEQKPFSDTMCRVSDYVDGKCSSGIGFWPYVIVLHYILLVKLILNTVLFALFNATGARIGAKSDSIWKFQRYKLIITFSNSLRLPPPLNIFSVIIIVIRFLVRCCNSCMSMLKGDERKASDSDTDEDENDSVSLDYSYWKQLANDYFQSKEREKEEESYVKKELDVLSQLSDDLNRQEQVIHRAKSQIRQLESDLGYIHAHLETLKYREKKIEETKTISLHSLSRESPYPRTKIERFPVPDKYVPWEVTWLYYEPLIYTMPKKEFSNMLQPYVDDDINMKREEDIELQKFKWNVESVDANDVYRNRTSWMTDYNDEYITYRLDMFDLPRNPMGRTGLRGKGALPRWGPNHNLFAIITRWKTKKSDKDEETLMETSDLLEYVETWFTKRKDLSLPGGFVWSENRYEVIQSCFKMGENEEAWQSDEDMINFFREYITTTDYPTDTSEADEEEEEDDFSSKRVYCGYMDDHMNTDQAWKEVELWHIHFKKFTNLYKSFKANIRWRVLSEDVFIQLPYGQTKLLQDAIRPLNATIADI